MFQLRCNGLWRSLLLAAMVFVATQAKAKESSLSLRDAEQYVAAGDLKSAVIELKNAVAEAPQDPVIHARLAKIYLQLEDFEGAEREARAAHDLNGSEADYLPVLADALLREQKFGDVIELIEPGNREPALESEARTAYGTAASALHYDTEAEVKLRDAIRLDPAAVTPKIQLAQLLNRTNPEAADQVIAEAIAANPRSVELLGAKGEIRWSRGDVDGAMHAFDEALEIDPESLPARLSRAKVNVARDQFAAADEDLDRVLKTAPDDLKANYLRGWEQIKQQQYAAADRTFDRISPRFSNFPDGYYLQGVTKLALGQFAVAERTLARYLDRGRFDQRAARLIAIAALQQHSPSRAIEYLKPVVNQLPPDPETLALLGNAYMADGKPALALEQFEKAAALDPENPSVKTRVAMAEIDSGQGERGLAKLEEVFAGRAGAVIAGPSLVLADLRAGRLDDAATVAKSLVERDARNPLFQTLLGEVRAAQQDFASAEGAFKAALALRPDFAAATRDLARLYVANGRVNDAKAIYGDLLKKDASDASALVGLADIAIAEQKSSEATALLNKARSAAKFDPTPGLKLVDLYESQHDWNSANAVAAELSAQFPRNPHVIETRGRTQIEAGDTNGALSSYKLAYQLNPDSLPTIARYVGLLKQEKLFREAFDVLERAVAQHPDDRSLKADLIRAIAETDGVDVAILTANEFAEKDADTSIYARVSAEVYEKAGRAGDAAAALEQALVKWPGDDDLPVALSRLYTRMGNFEKALAALSSRLRADPKNLAANSAMAPLYVMTGRPDDAKRAYAAVLLQKPNDFAALVGFADIAVAEKKWSDGIEYINRARAASPNDPAPGLILVNLYILRQDWQNAVGTAGELAEKFPRNVDVIEALGRAQLGAGDTSTALATYERAYELAPDSPKLLLKYLDLLKAAKNFSEARIVLQAALERDPRNASLKAELIRIQAETDGLDAGLAAAREFAIANPDNNLYDLVSAELYETAGRSAEAIVLLEKAVAARSGDTVLTTALARLYVRTGKPAMAKSVLKTRVNGDPNDVAARSGLAQLYLDLDRTDAAIVEYSKVIEDQPANPYALNNLAWAYQRQGELAKAREMAERAYAISPRDSHIDDTLGWVLLDQGEAANAIVYLNAANLWAPADPSIRYHLAVAFHRVGREADARAVLETLLGSDDAFAERAEAERLLQELKRG